MDEFSHPLKIEKRELCAMYHIKPRNKWAGRELVVDYDERFPLEPGFKNRYSYIVRFKEKGNCAGNHYHLDKAEIMLPLAGDFEIRLEDIKTKKQEKIFVTAADNIAFYLPVGVSHAIKSLLDTGLILMTASTPAQESDIFPYPIV